MTDELFLRPVHFIGNLRQERSTAIAFTDIDAMTMQFKLIQAMNTPHGRQYRDLDVYVSQFINGNWHKSWILKGSSTRHLCNDFMQRNIFAKMSDATTQTPLLMQRYEGPTL